MLRNVSWVFAFGCLLGLVVYATPAQACGIKSVAIGNAVSAPGVKSATAGRMIVYGATKVSRRLALAIKAAGHRVKRSRRVTGADIVLTSNTLSTGAQRALKRSGAVVVMILAEGQSKERGVKYAVRSTDRVYRQLATLERALRAKRRG